jgi:hypothetical protein
MSSCFHLTAAHEWLAHDPYGRPKPADAGSTPPSVVAPLEHPSETITVLAPVLDSLGDVAGLIELSALHPDAQGSAPAWS